MAERKVSIRLGTVGGQDVTRTLETIAQSGEASAGRIGRAFKRDLADAEAALQRVANTQAKANALVGGVTPARADAWAGISNSPGKDAQSSAAVFNTAYQAMETRAHALRAAMDPLYAAQSRYNNEIREAKTLLDAGVISTDVYQQKLRMESAALQQTQAAHQRAGVSVGQLRAGYQQLSFQIGDVATSLASGSSPMTVFAQQAGQMIQAFQLIQGGGAGGAADAIDATTGAADRLTGSLATNRAAIDSNTGSEARNIAGREGQTGATASATRATTTNTLQTGLNTAATDTGTAATTGFALAKARVAALMAGPWGAAIIGGVTILGFLASKLGDTEDAVAAESKSLEDNAAKAAAADRAKAAFARTEAGALADIRAINAAIDQQNTALTTNAERWNINAKNRLEMLGGTRAGIADELSAARSTASGLRSGGLASDASLNEARRSADAEVTRLEQRLAVIDRNIAEGNVALQRSRVQLAADAAKVRSDPIASLKKGYDDRVADLLREQDARAKAGRTIDSSITREIEGIIRARDAAVEAEQKKQAALRKTDTVRRDSETATAASIAKMLRGELPGVNITSTTGGQHVKGSYHYRNQAVDFVPQGGMGSMTKDDVRRIFESRGVNIVELLGPGDKGHSDHFHVAWTKGKLALDGFTDAAKRAKAEEDGLADLMQRFDPAGAAQARYGEDMKAIGRAGLSPDKTQLYRENAQAALLKETSPELFAPIKGFEGFMEADKEREASDKRRADFIRSTLADQAEGLMMARAELGLVGRSDAYREAEIAKLQMILRLQAEGVSAESDKGRAMLANAEALARIAEETRRAQGAWDEIQQVGGSALDRLFDPSSAETWGQRVMGIFGDLQNELVKLALLNPLKNMLFGQSNTTFLDVITKGAGLFGGGSSWYNPAGAASTSWYNPTGNATGTEHWSGGATWLAENGPELVNLPKGSRVTSASETRRMLAGNDNGPGINMPISIDARGADPAGLARVEAQIASLREGLPAQIVSVWNDARSRRYFG